MADRRIDVARLRRHAEAGGFGVERPSTLLALLDAVEAARRYAEVTESRGRDYSGAEYAVLSDALERFDFDPKGPDAGTNSD